MLDVQKLEELYVAYGFFVHRRCARLLGSSAEADDALQEVFVRALRYGHGLRDETSLAWLYGIADRHCFDLLARRRRIANAGAQEHALAERGEQASDAALAERLQLVAQVLARCSQRVRDVAVLYYVDEMTQDEVASQVGISRKTVKEKLAQFLQTARSMLLSAPNGKET